MNRKKVLGGFAAFLIFMWLCTVISKSVYTTKLPVVSTETLQSKYIEHRVEADGIVVEGGKQAVTTLPGLRVAAVLVHPGDRVESGDLLFQIDLDDLKEIIASRQVEINTLKTQISTMVGNQELEQQRRELEEARAREDYDSTARLENTDVERAYDKLVRAEQALEDFQNDPDIWSMSEEDRQKREQELRDAVQSAAYGEADAKRQRDQEIKNAGRTVEDILFPEEGDSALSVSQAQLSRLQEELAPYQEILENQGNVTAQAGGMVTEIYVEAGGRVPDAAAMLLTDDSLPCQFKVVLDKEQKKYVGFGDKVSLKLDGSRDPVEAQVNYFFESLSAPGSFETLIDLPEGTGFPGLSGKLICSKQGEKYKCCISPGALHKDNLRDYVYVLDQREGILGQEYYVSEVTVKVLDQNDNWVAVESGALDDESRIITTADQEISRGDVVRYIE